VGKKSQFITETVKSEVGTLVDASRVSGSGYRSYQPEGVVLQLPKEKSCECSTEAGYVWSLS